MFKKVIWRKRSSENPRIKQSISKKNRKNNVKKNLKPRFPARPECGGSRSRGSEDEKTPHSDKKIGYITK